MASEIEFLPGEPRYVFERDCLAFDARVDGKPVECLVTAELLMSRFGARGFTEEVMREAFQEHRAEIQEIARQHIENGWIDEEANVVLTTRFTQLNVTFAERTKAVPAVALTHRVLAEIIGPNAGLIDISWDVVAGSATEPQISLRVVDPSSGYNSTVFPRPKVLDSPTHLRLVLADVWADVLRRRSQKLILKSG